VKFDSWQGQGLFYIPKSPDWLWDPHTPYPMPTARGFLAGVRAART